MSIFGSLTYRNIRLTGALTILQVDRQVKKMIMMQIILVIISMSPFGIMSAYICITTRYSKTSDQRTKEYFVLTIVVLISYLYYVVCILFTYIFYEMFFL
jgi:small neutral amino acid transporter SnatA (MarC family)